ncbi:hypothetical protein [Moraxella lacunata]
MTPPTSHATIKSFSLTLHVCLNNITRHAHQAHHTHGISPIRTSP